MAQALPLAKLGTLLIKTLSKPVSKRIKHDFSRNNVTKQMLISIGQMTHSITSRMTIWSAGYKVRSIPKLEEEKALSSGADFVGEGFVLCVTAGTVIWEYNRSKEKDALKEAKRRAEAKAERDALQVNFKALDERLKAVEEVVQYNSQSILNVSGKKYKLPDKSFQKMVPISEDEIKKESTSTTTTTTTTVEEEEEEASLNNKNKKSWWKFW